MSLKSTAPTLSRVLSALPASRMKILYEYAQKHAFHRGRQWFGVGMRVSNGKALGSESGAACPVAAAFHVKRDTSSAGWFSARLDENLLAAIKHIVVAAGRSEDGMEEYLKELENTDPVELHQFVEHQYRTLTSQSTKPRSTKSKSRKT